MIVGAGDTAYADRIGTDDGVNWQVFRPGEPLRDPGDRRDPRLRGQVRRRRPRAPLRQSDHARDHQGAPGDQSRRPPRAGARDRLPDLRAARARQADQGRDHVGRRRRLRVRPVPDHHASTAAPATASRSATCSRAIAAARSSTPPAGRDATSSTPAATGWDGLETKPVPVVPDPPQHAAAAAEAGKVVGVAQPAARSSCPTSATASIFVFRVFEKMSYALVMRSTAPDLHRRRGADALTAPQRVAEKGLRPLFLLGRRSARA